MFEQRKIALVAKRLSFKEAEEADNLYWAETSEQYRLKALMDLRVLVFGRMNNPSIKKVVVKRRLYE